MVYMSYEHGSCLCRKLTECTNTKSGPAFVVKVAVQYCVKMNSLIFLATVSEIGTCFVTVARFY